MESSQSKGRKNTSRLVWQRAGTGRAKELVGTAATPRIVSPPSSQPGRLTVLPGEQGQPVALHTHSYTYVFNRLTHHTHRTQLQRAYCAGLYGAARPEPNTAFYTELDERLRLQQNTLTAVRNKLVVESLAAASHAEGVDTVAMRQAVNSSLERQMDFFTSCMERLCGRPCRCAAGCSCGCSHAWDTDASGQALATPLHGHVPPRAA